METWRHPVAGPEEIRALAEEQERSMFLASLRALMSVGAANGFLAMGAGAFAQSWNLITLGLFSFLGTALAGLCFWMARTGPLVRAICTFGVGGATLGVGFAFAVWQGGETRPQLIWEQLVWVVFLLAVLGMTLILFLLYAHRVRQSLSVVVGSYQGLHDALSFRDDFLTQAHHELRTPFTALKLQLQDLHRQSIPGSTPGRVSVPERKLVECRYQLERLRDLIERLLDLTSLNAQKLVLDRQDVDFVAVVREVVNRHSPQHRSSGTPVTVTGDEAVRGRWDRIRLEQIVTNLLTNALKYGAGKPVELRIRGSGAEAVLSVSDQGIGISAEDQQRIFERFERASAARNHGGLGLGLWIVHELVAAHGGQLNVASAPGEGSTFTVHLPDRFPDDGDDGVSASDHTTPHLQRLSG